MNGLPRTTQKRGKVSLRTQSRWDPRNIRQKQCETKQQVGKLTEEGVKVSEQESTHG